VLLFSNGYDIIDLNKEVALMNTIGDFIKERRLARDWSKRTLAEKAGISHSEVHRIENGERLNPSVPVLYALADALGIPRDDILLQAGYKSDNSDVPMIEKVFPDLKTEKQQETAQKIVDGLARNGDLKDTEYDDLVRQVEMFLEYAKKKRDSE
jgi:transcriptional regulator with XRE-family HTH domain